jgi:peroxiredoxin
MISIGNAAPDFTLKDQNNKDVKLSKFMGKKVVLSFRPLAWTPVCHDQMLSLEEKFEQFENIMLSLSVWVLIRPHQIKLGQNPWEL